MMSRTLLLLPVTTMFMGLVCCQGQQTRRQSQTAEAGSSAQEILNRIAEVESRLTSPVMIEGAEQVFHSLAEQMEAYKVPGVSVAVINNGKIEWAKGYGVREAGTDSPIDANTLFQAASISKSVSALGALHWVQKGALELDTDINDFLVSWRIPDNEFTKLRPVTLRYLLSHGAGVSGHSLGTYYRGEEIPTVLQILDGMPPSKADPVRVVAEPQTEFKYSGGGYLVVLQAMTDVTGQPFPDIMSEAVLRPAGMERSNYFQSLEHDSAENVAAGHGGMGSVVEGYWQIMPNPAGGGLWTTPSELCLFAVEVQKALRGESAIISRQIAEEMITGHIGDYGLGLILQGEGEDLAFSHGGDNAGYGSFFFAYARRGQGVAVMTNAQNGHYLYNEILRSVGIVYDWPDLKPSVIEPIQLPVETLNRYTGRYLWNNALGAEITIDNDHLRMEGDDGRIFLLYADSDNHFYDLYSGWELKFIFDEENEVTGAFLVIGGETVIRGEKTDN
ncbi:MAG: serine hydrolase [Gemmatimonadota bacterium]|nr:MAG: serine hydrolase [Gemmatimonadota bacterium]